MKVILIKTDGSTKGIKINSLEEARQIIYDFDYDRDFQELNLIDDCIILAQEKTGNTFSEVNQYATDLAIEMMAISPSDYITGDAILIEDTDEFEILRENDA